MSFLGGLISAGASLLGGALSNKNKSDTADQNIAMQKEFAQNGIQWRVEDAKKAGIAPLAALGANTVSFSPIDVGDTSFGPAISDMGQNIGRAVDASMDAGSRQQTRMNDLQIENQELQNDALRLQIAGAAGSISRASNPPMASAVDPFELPGQTQSGFKVSPVDIPATPSGRGDTEAGAIPSVTWQRTSTGGLVPLMARSAGAGSGDIFEPATLEWWLRNRVAPFLSGLPAPSVQDFPLDPKQYTPGMWRWKWSPLHQEFRPAPKPEFDGSGRALRRALGYYSERR